MYLASAASTPPGSEDSTSAPSSQGGEGDPTSQPTSVPAPSTAHIPKSATILRTYLESLKDETDLFADDSATDGSVYTAITNEAKRLGDITKSWTDESVSHIEGSRNNIKRLMQDYVLSRTMSKSSHSDLPATERARRDSEQMELGHGATRTMDRICNLIGILNGTAPLADPATAGTGPLGLPQLALRDQLTDRYVSLCLLNANNPDPQVSGSIRSSVLSDGIAGQRRLLAERCKDHWATDATNASVDFMTASILEASVSASGR